MPDIVTAIWGIIATVGMFWAVWSVYTEEKEQD